MTLKFIDFFAGVGGFRKGLEMAGHKCVGFVEWDKFARQSYQAIFETEGEYTENDIRAVRANELPRANIWCFGFPCQDISIAGKQEGFDGERSSLFYGVTKLIRELKKEDKPELLFIENVKNLLSVNDGFDFLRLQVELDEIGYNLEWDVLNSSILESRKTENVPSLSDILEENIPEKFFLSEEKKTQLIVNNQKSKSLEIIEETELPKAGKL